VGITIDTFTDTCNTSTGNQTFTGSLDGLTPKAVMIHLTNCTALDTLTADAIECWGCATGTGANEEWCQSNWDDDGLGTSTTQRSNSLEDIVYVTDAADTVQAEANFVSFGANAVTINWATASSHHVICRFGFIGASCTLSNGRYRSANNVHGNKYRF
jgi:hypothetical protein